MRVNCYSLKHLTLQVTNDFRKVQAPSLHVYCKSFISSWTHYISPQHYLKMLLLCG